MKEYPVVNGMRVVSNRKDYIMLVPVCDTEQDYTKNSWISKDVDSYTISKNIPDFNFIKADLKNGKVDVLAIVNANRTIAVEDHNRLLVDKIVDTVNRSGIRYFKTTENRLQKTVEQKNYEQLEKLVPDLLERKTDYVKFFSPGMEPVSMEWIGSNRIAISAYYLQNGDMMADPDMEFVVDKKNGTLSARTFQNDGMGIYQSAENYNGQVDNPKLVQDLNSFTHSWLKQIEQVYERESGKEIEDR